ncbi:MAG: hypothetical protein WCI22_07600 [Actinomycetota bacterium]
MNADDIPVVQTPSGGYGATMPCDGDHLWWDYVGFNARLTRMSPLDPEVTS